MDNEKLHSKEVEVSILGAMIIDPKSCIQVTEAKVIAEDFYKTAHENLFNAIKTVFKEKSEIDLLLLLEYLKNKNMLDKVGGVSNVTEISSNIVTTANLNGYIELLKGYSAKRKMKNIANYINLNLDKSVEEIQQETTTLLADLMEERNTNETTEFQEDEYLEILEKRMSQSEETEIKTGISKIDNEIIGFNGGDLITIFAFSGIGKTALAAQIALNNIKNNKRVLFFSLEMPRAQVRDRMISNLANISFKKLRTGHLEDKELCDVIKGNSYLSSNKRLLISEEDELINITNKIQLEVMKNDISIIFIDYINLINITGNNKEEFYRVGECTRLLKKLAIKVNRPIVILAQGKQEQASKMLNKNLNVWEKVAVNDIAGGASIYRDSDIVIGMYRNTELDNAIVRDKLSRENSNNIDYSSKQADKNPECMNLLIKKSRASGKNIIAVRWKAEFYRISDWY